MQGSVAPRHAAADPEKLRALLRAEIVQRGQDVAAFAAECGFPARRLTRFLSGQGQLLRRSTLAPIARSLGRPLVDLEQLQGGYLPAKLADFYNDHPPGDPLLKARGAKGAEKRRGQRRRPDTIAKYRASMRAIRPQVDEKRKRTLLQRLAENPTAASWQRWIAGGLLTHDIDREQLALRSGITREHLYRLMQQTRAPIPRPPTIQRLEIVLGACPIEVTRELRAARSTRAGGRTSQHRLRKRAEKWTLERLQQELTRLGPEAGARGEARIRERRLLYGKPLGRAAYDIYTDALACRARAAPKGGRWGEGGMGHPRTARGQLRIVLSGLRRRSRSPFYLCQACRMLWKADAKHNTRRLCGGCWKAHSKRMMSWIGRGRVGPAPALPRGRGRTMEGEVLADRLQRFLEWRLGAYRPDSTTPNEYYELTDAETRLQESVHPWCQRVVSLLRAS